MLPSATLLVPPARSRSGSTRRSSVEEQGDEPSTGSTSWSSRVRSTILGKPVYTEMPTAADRVGDSQRRHSQSRIEDAPPDQPPPEYAVRVQVDQLSPLPLAPRTRSNNSSRSDSSVHDESASLRPPADDISHVLYDPDSPYRNYEGEPLRKSPVSSSAPVFAAQPEPVVRIAAPLTPNAAPTPLLAPKLRERWGFHYTAWGTPHSLGSGIGFVLHGLLSAPLRDAGNRLQGGHGSGARYWAGAILKGLAGITGSVIAIACGAVSVAEVVVSNLLGGVLRAAGAASLVLAAVAIHAVGSRRTADELLGAAEELFCGISFLSKGRQSRVPQGTAKAALPAAALTALAAGAPGMSTHLRAYGLTPASDHDLPPEILSVAAGGNGRTAKLRYDAEKGLLRSDAWSALAIRVFVEKDARGNISRCHLAFAGAECGSRVATIKSCIAQALLGIEDSAFQEARAIVEAFVARYGQEKIQLAGHSLGGALAQWAGMWAGVNAIKCFNSAGLHVHLRDRLGAVRIGNADVEHFNTPDDPLSQYAEAWWLPLLPAARVGRNYLIPDSKGHLMPDVYESLFAASLSW